MTTKQLAWKSVVSELLRFLEGSDDERRLAEIRFGKDRYELMDLSKYLTTSYITLFTNDWVRTKS